MSKNIKECSTIEILTSLYESIEDSITNETEYIESLDKTDNVSIQFFRGKIKGFRESLKYIKLIKDQL